jgi:UMF1 family MFS transporter
VLERSTFLIAGAILGSGLGGVAVTDRLFLIRLAPAERMGEMFGLFGLVGKLSAVVGPLMYGGIVLILQPQLGTLAYQIAILSLLVLMLIGLAIVRGVPQPPAMEVQP